MGNCRKFKWSHISSLVNVAVDTQQCSLLHGYVIHRWQIYSYWYHRLRPAKIQLNSYPQNEILGMPLVSGQTMDLSHVWLGLHWEHCVQCDQRILSSTPLPCRKGICQTSHNRTSNLPSHLHFCYKYGTLFTTYAWRTSPLPSSRQHPCNDDCPENKTENYQNCSELHCVRQLYTMIHTHEQFLKLTVGLHLL